MATKTLQRGIIDNATPEVGSFRVLSRADLTLLGEKRPVIVLQTLRDTHHRIARAVAAGLPNIETATLCGVSYNRISILKKDPAFMELVAHYRSVVTAEFVRVADPVIEYLSTNALKAQAMLSDKLDDFAEKGEFLPTRDLLGIAELGLDRTGYGKVNKNLNVNVDFAANLEAARKRSAGARDITPTNSVIEAATSQSAIEHVSRPSPLRAQSPLFRRL